MPRIVRGVIETKRGHPGSRKPIEKLHGAWKAGDIDDGTVYIRSN